MTKVSSQKTHGRTLRRQECSLKECQNERLDATSLKIIPICSWESHVSCRYLHPISASLKTTRWRWEYREDPFSSRFSASNGRGSDKASQWNCRMAFLRWGFWGIMEIQFEAAFLTSLKKHAHAAILVIRWFYEMRRSYYSNVFLSFVILSYRTYAGLDVLTKYEVMLSSTQSYGR